VQSQLSSKDQDLETTNGTIEDMKARVGTVESSIEFGDVREKQLMKDLDNMRRL
jgi:hypothetical protein